MLGRHGPGGYDLDQPNRPARESARSSASFNESQRRALDLDLAAYDAQGPGDQRSGEQRGRRRCAATAAIVRNGGGRDELVSLVEEEILRLNKQRFREAQSVKGQIA